MRIVSKMRALPFAPLAAVLLLGLVLQAAPARAGGVINSSFLGSVAIEGIDPVAYFAEGRPVEGSSEHEYEWMGATWRFASAENRDKFAAEPEKYAPQYGGYCAWAVAQGYTAKIDPEAWKIVDGKLYLNYSPSVQTQWSADVPGNIVKGDANGRRSAPTSAADLHAPFRRLPKLAAVGRPMAVFFAVGLTFQ